MCLVFLVMLYFGFERTLHMSDAVIFPSRCRSLCAASVPSGPVNQSSPGSLPPLVVYCCMRLFFCWLSVCCLLRSLLPVPDCCTRTLFFCLYVFCEPIMHYLTLTLLFLFSSVCHASSAVPHRSSWYRRRTTAQDDSFIVD